MFLRLMACLLALGLGACQAPEEVLLRVATNVWPGYELLYVARSLGFFDEHRLRLVELTSATDVSQALLDGRVEAAALTLDEVLAVRGKGAPLRVILVFDYSAGADALLARPDILDPEHLKGKRIGVENTAVGAILLDAALTEAGLDAKAIKTVYLTADEQENAYLGGEVDGVVTFEPVKSRLMGRGARRVFDSSRIPGRIVDVLAVREDALADHSEHLTVLLRGYFRAFAYWRSHPEQAAALMAPRLAVPVPRVLESFGQLHLIDLEENRRLLAGLQAPLDTTARHLADFMAERRLLSVRLDFGRLADAGWLPVSTP
jgi:NitT/TauT family transport system substrate-binding protein